MEGGNILVVFKNFCPFFYGGVGNPWLWWNLAVPVHVARGVGDIALLESRVASFTLGGGGLREGGRLYLFV